MGQVLSHPHQGRSRRLGAARININRRWGLIPAANLQQYHLPPGKRREYDARPVSMVTGIGVLSD